jgi:hypothetical protein
LTIFTKSYSLNRKRGKEVTAEEAQPTSPDDDGGDSPLGEKTMVDAHSAEVENDLAEKGRREDVEQSRA